MGNTTKNTGGVTGKGFDVLGQPSPEAKKKGWEARRERQEIADEMMKLKDMTYAELMGMLEDINAHPEKYTVKEVKLARYIQDEKLTIDWIDRHMPKAPQGVDLTSGGEKMWDGIKVTIVNPRDEENTGT